VSLRLLTWNILNGGGDRLPAIIEVVREVRPDIWAVQELRDFRRYGWKRLDDLAAAVEMTAHPARSLFGQPVAVLTAPALRVLGHHAVTWRLHHAASTVVVETSSGPLSVTSTHLTPYRPYRRMREARWLAARLASRGGLAVVAGDLNGLAPGVPGEDHAAALAAMPPVYRRRHVGPDGVADTRAVGAFLDAGFTDLGRGAGPTVPTAGLRGPEFGATRLDHVLASPPLAARARDLRVIRGGAADHASDHYPVRVELDLAT
jgi:exodeoxyribonuclease-3